jgi:hypothetical protein
MRVVDRGVRDGFFSFELERRGANVLAVDHPPSEWDSRSPQAGHCLCAADGSRWL